MTIGPTFFYDPTNSRGQIFVVFAEGVSRPHKQELDETEDIEIVTLAHNDLRRALADGQLQVAVSAAAGYMALEREHLQQ